MKTRNTLAPSYHSKYHSKVTSTQEKGDLLFYCLAHGVWYISMFGLSQSFSDISSLSILVDVQRLHENGK